MTPVFTNLGVDFPLVYQSVTLELRPTRIKDELNGWVAILTGRWVQDGQRYHIDGAIDIPRIPRDPLMANTLEHAIRGDREAAAAFTEILCDIAKDLETTEHL